MPSSQENKKTAQENQIDEEEKKESAIINNANFEQPQSAGLSATPEPDDSKQKRIDREILAAIKREGVTDDVIREMLERGAHLDTQDNMGHTPLILAVYLNKPDIFKVVLEYELKLSPDQRQKHLRMQDNAGYTALAMAKHYKRDAMMAELMQAGAEGKN